MPGKHANPPVKRSYAGPVASAAVIAALLAGGAFGAVKLNQERTAAVPSSRASANEAADHADRASRGGARAELAPSASPSLSPSVTPSVTPPPLHSVSPSSAAPSSAAPRSPSAKPTPTRKATPAAKVVESGSCGASYYDEPQGTANGETFDPEALTAAHKEWDFDTRVRVVNPGNGKSVVVRINDRGPYIDGRCIDLSRAAFRAIADLDLGHIEVRYEVLDD